MTEEDLSSRYFHRMEEVVKLSQQPRATHVVLPVKPPASYRKLWNTVRDGPPPQDAFELQDQCNDLTADGDDDDDKKCASPSATTTDVSPEFKRKGLVEETINGPGLTLYQLYQQQCGSCSQCQNRSDCGSCIVCTQDGNPQNPRICVQKVRRYKMQWGEGTVQTK